MTRAGMPAKQRGITIRRRGSVQMEPTPIEVILQQLQVLSTQRAAARHADSLCIGHSDGLTPFKFSIQPSHTKKSIRDHLGAHQYSRPSMSEVIGAILVQLEGTRFSVSPPLALILFGNSATVIQTHFRSPSLGGQGVLTRLREKKWNRRRCCIGYAVARAGDVARPTFACAQC